MKKKLILLALFCLVGLFGRVDSVQAEIPIQFDINSKKAVLLCQYEYGGATQVSIYYAFGRMDKVNPTRWYIYYNKKGNTYAIANAEGYNFNSAFTKNKNVHFGFQDQRFQDSFENTFTCPSKAYLDFPWGADRVCFTNEENCGTKFESAAYPHVAKADDIFTTISNMATNLINTKENLEVLYNKGDLDAAIRAALTTRVKEAYDIGTTYEMPPFVENYIKNVEIKKSTGELEVDNYRALQVEYKKYVDEKVESGEITQEQAESEKEFIEKQDFKVIVNQSISSGINTEIREGDDCNAVFGPALTKVINSLFTFVQYLGPVLVAVLSIADFVKAALSGDPGDMKKASNKLAKRTVAAILLFFIPIICGILFELGGLTVPETCIMK